VHEIIVRALDEMQLLGPQIENRLEKRIPVPSPILNLSTVYKQYSCTAVGSLTEALS